jgi:putative protease
MDFNQDKDGVRLTAIDEDGNRAEVFLNKDYEEPRSMGREQVEKHVSRTGNSPFRVTKTNLSGCIGFLSAGFLNGIRRQVLAELLKARLENYHRRTAVLTPNNFSYPEKRLDYHANVLNEPARRFCQRHGADVLESAFEILPEITGKEVLSSKYCILHELDACLKSDRRRRRLKQPLRISDRHHTYLLKFDCKACRMSLIFVGRN